ncbi:MAG: DinB family protein [Dehalococcoidia bacterium]|nr:DinB family protein [Dehalococcoidia bacterium]
MILTELAVLAGRAAAARSLLDALLDVIPDDYWDRRAQGELWSAREHLQHVATVDEPMRQLVLDAASGARLLRPYGVEGVAEAAERRAASMRTVTEYSIDRLREQMAETRNLLLASFEQLGSSALDLPVFIPGAVNSWGQPLTVSLRHYLASWAVHDSEHAEAIREAITTPPSPGDLALAARRRRRP